MSERRDIFYGAAIQGEQNRGARSHIHSSIIDSIRSHGYTVFSEHTRGKTRGESAKLLEDSIGPLPSPGPERTVYIRKKMIEGIEGDISGAVFEVSTPSIGTGVEVAHGYLRPRMGIVRIPILILYQQGYWPNDLSTMIRGITKEEHPNVSLEYYEDLEKALDLVGNFIDRL